MRKSLSKWIRDGIYSAVLRRAPRHVLKEEVARRQIVKARAVYGEFLDGADFIGEEAVNASGESGRISGELVQAIRVFAKPSALFLLPGERNSAKSVYGRISGIPELNILTAGLHEEMDFSWNFEESPPSSIPSVDLIASHAMIEHLINPHQHLQDCFELLKPGGHMIFHTVMPGFQYHRYPVDCLRFFPDWFEETARSIGAEVSMRSISNSGYIVYVIAKAGH